MIPVRQKTSISQSKQNEAEKQIEKSVSQLKERCSKHGIITLCCNIQKLRYYTFNVNNLVLDVLKYFLQIKLKRLPTDDDMQKYSLVLSTSKTAYPLNYSIRDCNLSNNDIFESTYIAEMIITSLEDRKGEA